MRFIQPRKAVSGGVGKTQFRAGAQRPRLPQRHRRRGRLGDRETRKNVVVQRQGPGQARAATLRTGALRRFRTAGNGTSAVPRVPKATGSSQSLPGWLLSWAS